MTPVVYMIALIVAIGILLLLTLKLKMNSFMALFFTALAHGKNGAKEYGQTDIS